MLVSSCSKRRRVVNLCLLLMHKVKLHAQMRDLMQSCMSGVTQRYGLLLMKQSLLTDISMHDCAHSMLHKPAEHLTLSPHADRYAF